MLRKLPNKELHNLYTIKWVEVGEAYGTLTRMHRKLWLGNLKRKRLSGRPRSVWKVTRKWILRKYDGRVLVWFRIGTSGWLDSAECLRRFTSGWREDFSSDRVIDPVHTYIGLYPFTAFSMSWNADRGCEIWGSFRENYDDYCLLGCNAV
jgi:hypothetical protein